jgi:hypothetical protein
MNRTLTVLFVVVAVAALPLAAAACSPNEAAEPTVPTPTPAEQSAPSPTPAVQTAPSPTPAVQNVCPPNPDPAPPTVAVVSQPLPNASVTSPLTVSGMVEAFEATFQAQLLDGQQNQLAHVVGMSSAGQVLSPFSVQLTFSVTAPTPACLRIYQQSAKDGSDTKIVLVPLVLLP